MTTPKADPLALAQWLDGLLDLGEISSKLVEKFGLDAAPAKLLALTPHELSALFTRAAHGARELDRVAELVRHNHVIRAARNIEPATPPWLMPQVPRVHS